VFEQVQVGRASRACCLKLTRLDFVCCLQDFRVLDQRLRELLFEVIQNRYVETRTKAGVPGVRIPVLTASIERIIQDEGHSRWSKW
jgi:hypothetical protein